MTKKFEFGEAWVSDDLITWRRKRSLKRKIKQSKMDLVVTDIDVKNGVLTLAQANRLA